MKNENLIAFGEGADILHNHLIGYGHGSASGKGFGNQNGHSDLAMSMSGMKSCCGFGEGSAINAGQNRINAHDRGCGRGDGECRELRSGEGYG